MNFDDYLKALGYSQYGDNNMRWQDPTGENVSSQYLGQLQDAYNAFSQTDAQGRPVYGTEAYLPGTMSGAYSNGLYRLGQADAGAQLQPILDSMGASVQYDPRYGYVIPQAAQDEWSRQYGQPKGFDAFLEGIASNMPLALGGAVLGAGFGYGPLANASTIPGGPLVDFSNLMGTPSGGGGAGFGGGAGDNSMFDWTGDLFDNWDLMGDPSAYGLGDAAGAAAGTAAGAAPIVDLGRQASISDMLRNALGGGMNLGSLASLASGALQGLGAYAGANQQANAAQQAAANQMAMFNTLNQQSAPWRQAGVNALNTIGSMMPDFTRQFTNADLNSQLAPNFQFMLDKGVNATKNALNVGGGLVSGNTIQGINDYAQNYAQNAYQQAFNNWNAQQSNIFNRLSTIAGLGQTANQTTANAGTALGQSAGQATQNAGTAAGGGIVGATNAVTGGLNNALGWYMLPQFLGNYGGYA